MSPVRVEEVTFPTFENVYGPPLAVPCPTWYWPTLYPNPAPDAVQESATSPFPALADTADAAVTNGKYKNPKRPTKLVAVELPIMESPAEKSLKLADVPNPPPLFKIGARMMKLELVISSARAKNGTTAKTTSKSATDIPRISLYSTPTKKPPKGLFSLSEI